MKNQKGSMVVWVLIILTVLISGATYLYKHKGQPATSINNEGLLINQLVGTWNNMGSSANTLSFRADKTFAIKENGKINIFNEKCNQDGECSGGGYPSSATTTGTWSVITDTAEESKKYPESGAYSKPPEFPSLKSGHFFVKEDVGLSNPWYFDVEIDGSNTLVITQLFQGGGTQKYKKQN